MIDAAILDLAVSIPHHYVKLSSLAAARGVDPDKYRKGLGCEEMAVCGPGEDTVTLAANAAATLLEKNPQWRERIGLCIVGTESGVDQAKPTAIYVHGLLGLSPRCRVFEIKHACYSASAALQMARAWLCMHPKRAALVIASDVARYDRFSPGEATQGAGAVAMLLGCVPPKEGFLTLSRESGAYANEVHDFWRPTYQTTAMVKGRFSMSCYLEGLLASYDDYIEQSDDTQSADYMLYHVPFPKMARKGHRALFVHLGGRDEDQFEEDYARRVEPFLWANRRVGNIYSGSLYLMLAGLSERKREALQGRKVALFSYGSGSCSEFFTARFGDHIPKLHLKELFESRCEVDVLGYETLQDHALSMERDGSHQTPPTRRDQPFFFAGIRDHERIYKQNPAYFDTPPEHDTPNPQTPHEENTLYPP